MHQHYICTFNFQIVEGLTFFISEFFDLVRNIKNKIRHFLWEHDKAGQTFVTDKINAKNSVRTFFYCIHVSYSQNIRARRRILWTIK